MWPGGRRIKAAVHLAAALIKLSVADMMIMIKRAGHGFLLIRYFTTRGGHAISGHIAFLCDRGGSILFRFRYSSSRQRRSACGHCSHIWHAEAGGVVVFSGGGAPRRSLTIADGEKLACVHQ